MKKNYNESNTPEVSPIIETYDETGKGLLGITVMKADASFENIMIEFTEENYDQVYAELQQLRIKKLK